MYSYHKGHTFQRGGKILDARTVASRSSIARERRNGIVKRNSFTPRVSIYTINAKLLTASARTDRLAHRMTLRSAWSLELVLAFASSPTFPWSLPSHAKPFLSRRNCQRVSGGGVRGRGRDPEAHLRLTTILHACHGGCVLTCVGYCSAILPQPR
jgi:hypothetical protein